MNSRLKKKIVLDFVMTVFMIILMGYFVSGPLWHEIFGVGVLILIILHNLINLKWFIGIIRSKNKITNFNYKMYIRICINLLLIVNTAVLLISSVFISRELFVKLELHPTEIWYYLHRFTAYMEILLVSVHLGLHWELIMTSFRKMFKLKENNKIRNLLLRIIAFLLAVFGVKASCDRNIATNLLPDKKDGSYDIGSNIQKNININNEIVQKISLNQKVNEKSKYVSASNEILLENTDESNMTLSEYLGSLHCNGCGRHCSLLSPRCSKGEEKAEEAKIGYQKKYSTTSETEKKDTTNKEQETTNKVTTSQEQESNNKETSSQQQETTQNTEKESDSKEDTGNIVIELEEGDDLISLFTDFIPIMGLYTAGTYYSLKIIDKVKKKNKPL